jgi:hypothetical protein
MTTYRMSRFHLAGQYLLLRTGGEGSGGEGEGEPGRGGEAAPRLSIREAGATRFQVISGPE